MGFSYSGATYGPALGINPQTGTTYTFALSDAGKVVTASNASATTYTIPTNASTAFVVGAVIDVINIGAGAVTISGAGVTISGITYIPTSAQVRLLKTGTDTWWVTGGASTDAAFNAFLLMGA